MLRKIEISGVHYDVDDHLHKYVTRKIGRLERYIPRNVRAAAHAEVKLKDGKAKDGKEYGCEVILRLPHEIITVHETAINMYAAVDIVEAKLKIRLKKYKEQHAPAKLRHRVLGKFRGEIAHDEPA